ncbi:helix-turn-helix transcriptional regulator [Paractinoplanes atraurantiacus]|uniref:Regulatory protein, luxR family n=1 Tax=Paractinoplanes atraurantiacus TaxID=1036182 RepID=A0A285II68_9ACTN|nr:LuxR family transcriptional regulator [Actinoplanes atraurantiacus]SNY47700.1 regulatory protein, luxR family [Actinoplanes atraurantiacus]
MMIGATSGTVTVSGDAGSGKTTVLDRVAAGAGERGDLVLRCSGLPCSPAEPGAGLHELLHGVLDRVAGLPAPLRSALCALFGIGPDEPAGAPPPSLGLATLRLLERLAADRPVTVVVDDVQWLDELTAGTLDFVARRLRDAPILLVAASRLPLPWPGEALRLRPLPVRASEELLASVAPSLPASTRHRIAEAAAGNPLALREFAGVLLEKGDDGGPLPLTRRLRASLLAETVGLPPATWRFLVLLACAEQQPLRELMSSAARAGLRPEDLDPAERAGLVVVDGDRLRFRQALLRTAVQGAATWSERGVAHEALAAGTLDPGWAAWHRSALTVDADEAAAEKLEAAAVRASGEDALRHAMRFLRRAAALSGHPEQRARRLAGTAELARQGGRNVEAWRLIREVTTLSPSRGVLAQAELTRSILVLTDGLGERSAAETIGATLRAATDPSSPYEREAAARMLIAAGSMAWTHDVSADVRAELLRSVDCALHGAEATTLVTGVLAMSRSWMDPLGGAADAHRRLPVILGALRDRVLADVPELRRPTRHFLIAAARTAETLHDPATAAKAWDLLADAMSNAGAVTTDEVRRLAEHPLSRILNGQLNDAAAQASRARDLADRMGLPVLGALASATLSLARAWSTPHPAQATDRGRQSALVTAVGAWADGLLALRERRFADAYAALRATEVHRVIAWNAAADLAEAAVGWEQTGGTEVVGVARARLAEIEMAAGVLNSDQLRALAARGRALLDEEGAEPHFQRSDAAARRAGIPLELGRTLLAYGTWLRRRGLVLKAREQLGEARFLFDRAAAYPWAAMAAAELRAAGVATAAEAVDAAEVLTAQELRIARLAAQGMTNKQIGAVMRRSSRTIASYLYQIYPKLEISSRAQLRAVVGDPAP